MMFNCNGRKLKEEETKEQSRQTVSHWTQQFSSLLDTGRLASGADVVLTLESWLCVSVCLNCVRLHSNNAKESNCKILQLKWRKERQRGREWKMFLKCLKKLLRVRCVCSVLRQFTKWGWNENVCNRTGNEKKRKCVCAVHLMNLSWASAICSRFSWAAEFSGGLLQHWCTLCNGCKGAMSVHRNFSSLGRAKNEWKNTKIWKWKE